MECLALANVKAPRLPQRVDPRPPEGLVGVDVADTGHGSLIEDRRLHGCATVPEAEAEIAGAERRSERLRADTRIDVGPHLVRLEQEPGSEAPDIAVGDIRPVV